eukprot:CAMPEP_0197075836 /NCGR_PEP_ID=MMETSP1384-20130603/211811_1 /TAXON_ID=29189 /ORGANISM="Ammonia sp." /LENGTH=1092 /DNA_ID=CAMNT_0042514685 /DNA_START=40 /DNA_END=3318 /DNA_ORIENTATION=-
MAASDAVLHIDLYCTDELLQSPSVPESFTVFTDDEGAVRSDLDHSPEPPIDLQSRSRSRSNSHSHSHSRSHSHSYSESKVEKFVKQQQQSNYSYIQRPDNLPPRIPSYTLEHKTSYDEEEEMEDDEIFDRILISYARQESTSRDKRRSISTSMRQKSGSRFKLDIYRKKSPSSRLPTIIAMNPTQPHTAGASKPVLSPKGTRNRRAITTQPVAPSPSASNSYFDALRKCNDMNRSIPLPVAVTHIEPWTSGSPRTHTANESDANLTPEPSPMPPAMAPAIELVDAPKVNANKPTLHANAVSVDSFREEMDNQQFDGSVQLIRGGRRSTINPHKHVPMISRGLSEADIDQLVSGKDIHLEQDTDIDSDEDDEEEKKEFYGSANVLDRRQSVDPLQSELVFQKATQSLMVSCGNSKEVFTELRKICVSLKKEESFPYTIAFDDKLLAHDHVEAFLKLLGFRKNKSTKQYICDEEDRVDDRLIDCAIMECHKCSQEIMEFSSITNFVKTNNNNSANKPVQVRDKNANTNTSTATTSTALTLKGLPALGVVQQSRSVEESTVNLCDEDEEEEEDSDRVQLYELLWSITHQQTDDHMAENVLLLCYPLVTSSSKIMLCLEARFFNDDHEGRITVSAQSNGSAASALSATSLQSGGDSPLSSQSTNSSQSHLRGVSSLMSLEFSYHKTVKFDRILSSLSVQRKVIAFLQHWMNGYWDKDWHSNERLQKYCKQFMHRIKKAYQADTASNTYYEPVEIHSGLKMVEVLERTMKNNQSGRRQTLHKKFGDDINAKSPSTPKSGKHNKNASPTSKKQHKFGWKGRIGGSEHKKLPKDMIDVPFPVIAEQLTIVFFTQFRQIHARECLKQGWKHKTMKHILAPNIVRYIDTFNNLTKWIQSTILLADSVKLRARTIKRWTKVNDELYKLRNFHALRAVYSALESSSIYSLHEAWNLVPKRQRDRHGELRIVMKANSNFKNLRRLQLETNPPMLPYFGLFAQDLIMIEETNKKNRADDGSINWETLWKEYRAIDAHLKYQHSEYANLVTDATVQRWMNKELSMAGKLDDDFIYKTSLDVRNKDKRELGKLSSPKKNSKKWWKSK